MRAMKNGELQRMRPLFGSLCVVSASGPDTSLETAVEKAFAAMKDIEQRMHPKEAGSDLARLASRPAEEVEIAATTWQVLLLSKQVWTSTGGLFDPCVPGGGALSDLELRENSRAFARTPIDLDLGGIAKGFAIDCAIDALRDSGCVAGVVNAGGDVAVFGAGPHEILLRGARQPVSVANAALAATEVGAVDAPQEHRGYYSRVRGHSMQRRRAAVIAPTAAVADALTKCAIYCTPEQWEPIARAWGASLAPWQ